MVATTNKSFAADSWGPGALSPAGSRSMALEATGTRLSVKLQHITAGLCVLESCQTFLPHDPISHFPENAYVRLAGKWSGKASPVSANSSWSRERRAEICIRDTSEIEAVQPRCGIEASALYGTDLAQPVSSPCRLLESWCFQDIHARSSLQRTGIEEI